MKTNFKVYLNVSEFNLYSQNEFFVECNKSLNPKLVYDLFCEYYAPSFSEWKEYTNNVVDQNGLYLVECTYDLKNQSIELGKWYLCE